MLYNTQEVKTAADWKKFHRVPDYIYRHDPLWIAPLHSDVKKIFDPEQNPALQHGEARLWYLIDDTDKAVGRIAAFVDHQRNEELDYPVGGVGFFECINDSDAAWKLLETAEIYLRNKGVKAIDGPINCGERDKFWGLLTQGWHPPIYQENYNPGYYRDFFTTYDYRPHEQVLTFHGPIREFPVDRMTPIVERLSERYGMYCESMDMKDLPRAAQLFADVYNQAFSHQPYFKEISQPQVLDVLQQLKPIADPDLVCFCFADGKPVAFCGHKPPLNNHLRHPKGNLNWWTLPRFLWSLKMGKTKQVKGIAFGAIPEYQRKGATSLVIHHMYHVHDRHNPTTYDNVVLATIRGHNPLMIKTMLTLNVDIQRVHTAYRKMLDDSLPPHTLDFIDTGQVPLGDRPKTAVYPKA